MIQTNICQRSMFQRGDAYAKKKIIKTGKVYLIFLTNFEENSMNVKISFYRFYPRSKSSRIEFYTGCFYKKWHLFYWASERGEFLFLKYNYLNSLDHKVA